MALSLTKYGSSCLYTVGYSRWKINQALQFAAGLIAACRINQVEHLYGAYKPLYELGFSWCIMPKRRAQSHTGGTCNPPTYCRRRVGPNGLQRCRSCDGCLAARWAK